MHLSHYDRSGHERSGVPLDTAHASVSLVAVLWQRRWTVALAVLACTALAGVYLALATRVYIASAKVLVEQNDPEALGDKHRDPFPSESYVQTQADVFQSATVLGKALEAVHFRTLKTFAKADEDPVAWLRRTGALKVDVAKKSDVVLVSMESPWADEAAAIANSVVNEYIAEQSVQKQAAGAQMLAALTREKEELKHKRDASMQAMLKFKRENDVLSFGTDRGNTALERNATLATSLTTAEMTVIGLRAQLSATKKALADPASLSAFVEALQFKAKNAGDHEYDELRSQLVQEMLTLSTSSALEGSHNTRVRTLESVVTALRSRVAEKERAIAMGHLSEVSTDLAAAEENEQQLRKAMQAQHSELLTLGPQASEFAKLEAEAARIQKQCDLLDSRMSEISVNDLGVAPLNVQFLEPARAESKPVKPNKLLVLGVALMVGWVIGVGLALAHEWRDGRFRNSEEIVALLGTSVLATIPRINMRLSPMARGQILSLDTHSPSAEAYRSIRTSLHLGPYGQAKTILLASASPGDGKSTTASNLAIAFSQAGYRTLLIDCDMREPVQHLIFETHGSVGLSSVVAGEAKLADAIQETRIAGLYLLPCGPVPATPSELLSGKRFGLLMRALVGTFDRIVIDSPPLTMANDARIIAASADATMLVLRINQSAHSAVIHAMEELVKVGANVLGAVANDMPTLRANSYYRGSWQYASSAKRVMASVIKQEPVKAQTAPEPRRLTSEGSLAIAEPDWSAEEGSGSNDDKFSADDSAVPQISTGPAVSTTADRREW